MRERPVTLDEWYRMINSIYIDRNYYRSPDSVLTHLVEVAGGLSVLASGKRKPRIDPQLFMAKALGWWMVLCGKVGIRSVERMIWTKFPNVCPYCMQRPHFAPACSRARSSGLPIAWEELRKIGDSNRCREDHYPQRLRDWQVMFSRIYPRGDTTSYQMNYSRLAEELGELSETVRILQVMN
jgi:hypothetical protein